MRPFCRELRNRVCRRNRVRLAERIGHAYFFKLYFP